MSNQEKDPLQQLNDMIKDYWRENGNPHIIAAKHSEFVIEPKIFLGNKLNPEILKLLIVNYLASTSVQDSGAGNIEVTPEKLIIKSPKGKPVAIVRDKKIIQQYLSQQA